MPSPSSTDHVTRDALLASDREKILADRIHQLEVAEIVHGKELVRLGDQITELTESLRVVTALVSRLSGTAAPLRKCARCRGTGGDGTGGDCPGCNGSGVATRG